ncbi:A-kinase anchor protein 17B [Quillaja saponaria]|uniref:A-kinase anchor protein 17B n=1 Tax=Quillaja saponaria TaxID=32244 RepID=A0AAD7PTQ7_QUISA|nr:A-kinase anchor protein 17B [Quillaja saponaria]
MKSDYDVTWDKDGFFRNSRNQVSDSKVPAVASEDSEHYRSEAPKRPLQFRQCPSKEIQGIICLMHFCSGAQSLRIVLVVLDLICWTKMETR